MVKNKFKHEDIIGQPLKQSNFASEKNYRLGARSMGNSDNNISRPNYRNLSNRSFTEFPNSYMVDPYRQEKRNKIDSDIIKKDKDKEK